MADEQAATQGEWLWGDDPLDDPRPPGSAFDEPLQWPDALDWPPPPLPLGDVDFQAPPAPEAADAPMPPPPAPLEPLAFAAGPVPEVADERPLEPSDLDPGPAGEVADEPPLDLTAAAPAPTAEAEAGEPEAAEPPPDLDLIPTSIWGPVSALRSEPAEPGTPVIFGDTPASPVEDTQLSVQPIPESFWDQGPDEEPPVAAPVGPQPRSPKPRIYAEPERSRAGGAAAWFQVRHPTAAMAGLAVFVVLVVVGLVLSVRNKPDSSVTDAAQKGGTISAQRLPSTTVIPTTTATTTPVAVIDLQPPAADAGATPADVGGAPAADGAAPAAPASGKSTTPATRAAAPASSGGGGGSSGGGGGGTAPASTTGTTAAPAAPDTTQPPATSPPDTTSVTSAPSTTRRTITFPDDPVTSFTTPTTPTTPTSFDFTVPTRPGK